MKIKLQPLYFCTKSMLYSCTFKDMFNHLSIISCSSSKQDDTFFVKEFVKSFLSNEEFSGGKNISIYDPTKKDPANINSKKEYFLFYIDKEMIKLGDRKNAYLKLFANQTLTALSNLINAIESLTVKTQGLSFLLIELLDFYNSYKDANLKSFEQITGFYKRLKANLQSWKETFFYEQNLENTDLSNIFNSFFESERNIDLIYDFEKVLNTNLRILVLISRKGIFNLSFVCFDRETSILFNPNDNLQTCIIPLVNEKAKEISSIMNKLPKLFTVIDLNNLLKFENICVHQSSIHYVYDETEHSYNQTLKNAEPLEKKVLTDKELGSYLKAANFNKQIKTNKCIFIRFIAEECKNHKEAEITTFIYDYLSLLVGKYHSFDSYSLYSMIEDHPFDLLEEETQHFYSDDSQLTYTVINTSPQSYLMNSLTRTNRTLISPVSHKSRIYAFWDFSYICNCCVFSSVFSMTKMVFSEFVHLYSFARKNHKVISYASQNIERGITYLFGSFKTSHDFNETLFEELHISSIEDDLSNIGKLSWRQHDLSNTRLSYWYSNALAIVSCIIAIFSFGVVSKVSIDYIRRNSCSQTTKQTDVSNVLQGLFSSVEFWMIIAVSIIILGSIFAFFKLKELRIRSTVNNIVKKIGIVQISFKKHKK